MPGFSNAVQPGQTRYPNLLPKPPGMPVPQGFYLAELADTDIHDFYACIDEAVAEYIEHFELVAKTYKSALGIRREPNREKRLAMYMLKPAAMWLMQRWLFPGPSKIFPNFIEDWTDFTQLVQAAAEGEFDDSQEPELYDAVRKSGGEWIRTSAQQAQIGAEAVATPEAVSALQGKFDAQQQAQLATAPGVQQ